MNSPKMLAPLLPRMKEEILLIEGIQNESSKEMAQKMVRKNSTLPLMH